MRASPDPRIDHVRRDGRAGAASGPQYAGYAGHENVEAQGKIKVEAEDQIESKNDRTEEEEFAARAEEDRHAGDEHAGHGHAVVARDHTPAVAREGGDGAHAWDADARAVVYARTFGDAAVSTHA